MPLDPARAGEVAPALLEYARGRLDIDDVSYLETPAKIGRGFDTYIYSFRLQGEGLDPSWARPLVLRLYPDAGQADKAQREAAVQEFAASHGYPALTPLACERNAAPLGLPLMVMERAGGQPMLERFGFNVFKIGRLLGSLADAHAALHRLPIDGCPLPSEPPLVERRLTDFRGRIEESLLGGLDKAMAWLEDRKGAVMPEELSLTHNDFHPLNVMVDDDGRLTVLDWSDGALGDRLHDVARTLGLFRFAWAVAESRVERVALRLGQGFLWSRYLDPYRRALPFDEDRLHYWLALQAFAVWLPLAELADPEFVARAEVREDTLERLPPELLPLLRTYFWQLVEAS